MKLQVLIADPNREFQKLMTAQLSREGDMEAADAPSDSPSLDVLLPFTTPPCCFSPMSGIIANIRICRRS